MLHVRQLRNHDVWKMSLAKMKKDDPNGDKMS